MMDEAAEGVRKAQEAEESLRRRFYENTFNAKWMQWTLALKRNMSRVVTGKDVLSLPKLPEGSTVLCLGAGPSLYEHLSELSQFKGVVIACERVLIETLKAGVVPKYVVNLDCAAEYGRYVKDPLVTEHAKEMTGVFAVTGSPELIEAWPGEAVYFVKYVDEVEKAGSLSQVFVLLTGKTGLNSGGHAGSFAWILSRHLGAKRTVLLGYDYAYRADDTMENGQFWPILERVASLEERAKIFCTDKSAFGREIVSDLGWVNLRNGLRRMMATDFGEVIQCSDYTILHGAKTIKCMTFSDYLKGM